MVHKSQKSSGLACSVSQCSYPSIAKEVRRILTKNAAKNSVCHEVYLFVQEYLVLIL